MYRPRSPLRIVIAVLIIILLGTVIVGLVASWPNWFNDMNTQEPWHFPGFLIGLLITLIILGILVRVVLSLIFGPMHYRRYRRWSWEGPGGQDGRDILDQRYARGEITREQYNQMLEDLRRNRPPYQ